MNPFDAALSLFRRHIFFKYIAATLILGILGNAVVLVLYLQYRKTDQSGQIAAEIATVANRLARPASDLLRAGDIPKSRELLSIFAAYPYVICTDLRIEASEAPAVSWPVIGCSRIRKPGRSIDVSLPGVGTAASMHVRIDPVVLTNRLTREFAVLALLGTIGGLALTLAGIAAFLWFINRPLKLLLTAIEQFEQEGVPRHADYHSNDEIGKLISSYNSMLDRETERVTEIREAHESILDSVNYATRIQRGLLPTHSQLSEAFAEHSVLWQPRDLVGGDIYWINTRKQGTTIAIVDCTGHGVPGGFMSMLAIASLERILSEDDSLSPAAILTRLSDLTKGLLNQYSTDARSNDGMDAAICMIDRDSGSGVFAGAHLSLTICSEQGTSRIRGDRLSLGYADTPGNPQFQETRFALSADTRLLLHTDGIIDQVGGARGIAFGYKRFASIVRQHRADSLTTLTEALEREFAEYAAGEPRRDDLTVLAFRPALSAASAGVAAQATLPAENAV
ncbi:SpoIIE family protein phosphatase [Granulosicoccus sp. 3-233]|uniref:SpoIIE family protein phosphatase n=1 Tax=Granulosicoccus sp. 3-233 TaxID=3417969 RepID=UPI003D34EB38